MKPAFSTIACPSWTLTRVAETAGRIGALGVELRTFGRGSTSLACDPTLTSEAKVRSLFDKVGVVPFCLATSVRFDAPIFPPVIGRAFGDTEASVREGKSAVDLARELEIPYVRVFAFELHGDESRKGGIARIMERLTKVLDHCRNTGVKLLIENGGSFPTATDLAELIDRAASPLLDAAYCPAVAALAGESVVSGVNVLGDRLASVKLRDMKAGRACAIGSGDLHAGDTIDVLRADGYDGWVVAELDLAWLPAPVPTAPKGKGAKAAPPAGPDAEAILSDSVRFIYDRMGSKRESVPGTPRAAAQHS